MEELWKDIEEPDDATIHYQISNLGRVKRLPYTGIMRNQVGQWEQYFPEKILVGSVDSSGYAQVGLSFHTGDRPRSVLVHRLVATNFLPEPSEELVEECKKCGLKVVCVNHKDGNPLNNRSDNLEWCTPSYNNARQTKDYTSIRGEDNYCAVLTEKDVDEILRLRKCGLSQQKIADIFGVKQITISNICTGRSWAWYTGIERKPRTKGKAKQAKTKQLTES